MNMSMYGRVNQTEMEKMMSKYYRVELSTTLTFVAYVDIDDSEDADDAVDIARDSAVPYRLCSACSRGYLTNPDYTYSVEIGDFGSDAEVQEID